MSPQSFHLSALQLLVIADNLLARAGLTALLQERGCHVLAQTDASGLQQIVESVQPDILVVDLAWQGESIIEQLVQLEGELPVLALTVEDERGEALLVLWQQLSQFPGFALLPRDSDPETLVAALRALDLGLIVLDPSFNHLTDIAPLPQPSAPATPLTLRENEVLQLLAQGMTNKAIALALGITQHTVKFHVNAIMSKLHAQSRTEAVFRAMQLGLIVL